MPLEGAGLRAVPTLTYKCSSETLQRKLAPDTLSNHYLRVLT